MGRGICSATVVRRPLREGERRWLATHLPQMQKFHGVGAEAHVSSFVYFRQPCVNRDLTSTMMHSRGTATPKENLYLPKIFLRDTTKRFRYKVLHGIAIAEQTLQRPVF